MEQIETEFKTKPFVEKLKVLLSLNETMFIEVCEKMLNLAKNFEDNYPTLKNLIKYDSFTLDRPGKDEDAN